MPLLQISPLPEDEERVAVLGRRFAVESSEEETASAEGSRARWPWARTGVRLTAVAAIAAAVLAFATLGQSPLLSDAEEAHTVEAFEALYEKGTKPGPRLCTDGWTFEFKTTVSFNMYWGKADILKSSTDAIYLRMWAPLYHRVSVGLTIKTLDYGKFFVKAKMDRRKPSVILVEKTQGGLCLTITPLDDDKKGEKGRRVCSYIQKQRIPSTGFQMKPAGELTAPSGKGYKVSDTEQIMGFVPLTFTVSAVNYTAIWQNQAAWDKLQHAVYDSLALVAGHGIEPSSVDAYAAAADGDGAFFVSTVLPPPQPGLACAVQDALVDAAKTGTLSAALSERIGSEAKDVGLTSASKVSEATIPAEPMAIDTVRCRSSIHRQSTLPKSQCNGYACSYMACEDELPGSPIQPYEEPTVPLQKQTSAIKPAPLASHKPFDWGALNTNQFPEPEEPATKPDPALEELGAPDMSLEQKFQKFAQPQGATILGDLRSDGLALDFEVELALSEGAFSQPTQELAQTQNVGNMPAVKLTAIKYSTGTGKVRFEGHVLNAPGAPTGGCKVESGLLHLGSEGTKKYKVVLHRDDDQCCIEVAPSTGGGTRRKNCKTRTVASDQWGLRPMTKLLGIGSTPGFQVSNFKQTKMDYTMSFQIAGLDWAFVANQCKCEDTIRAAIKETIIYTAGPGVKDDQVSLTIQRGVAGQQGAKLTPGQLVVLNNAVEPIVEAEAPEVDKGTRTLETLMDEIAGKPRDVESNALLEQMADLQQEMVDANATEPTGVSGERRLQFGVEQAMNALANNQPFDPATFQQQAQTQFTGNPAVNVQATLENVSPQKVAKFKNPQAGFFATMAARVGGALPKGGQAIQPSNLQLPATPIKCGLIECGDYGFVNNALKMCSGAKQCQKECCGPTTCKRVTCPSPMTDNKWISKTLTKCQGKGDCADKCCTQSCEEYKCQGGAGHCKKENAWLLWATPTTAESTCCENRNCCEAPIATCLACKRCQSKLAYCWSLLDMGKHNKTSRRLEAPDAEDDEDFLPARERLLAAHAEYPLNENDIHGGLTAEVVPAGATPEEAEHDGQLKAGIREESDRFWRELAQEEESKRELLTPARATKRRLSQDAVKQHASLMSNADKLQKEAKDFFNAANTTKGAVNTKSQAQQDQLEAAKKKTQSAWNKAFEKLLKANGWSPLVRGCEIPLVYPCPYYLKSIFLLHRGLKLTPKAVNTVQVLSDTRHAVSCGDDGICWIWGISGGNPVQLFVPNAPSARGPVYSVSIQYDATYIISGGDNNAGGGAAYLWDWRYGYQTGTTSADLPVRSTFVEPAYRLSGVGSEDQFIYMWNWASDTVYNVPYNTLSTKDIAEQFAGRIKLAYENNLNGEQRLAVTTMLQTKTVSGFLKLMVTLNPLLKDEFTIMNNTYTSIDKWLHTNRYGPVLSLTYTPSSMHFVSGSADHHVRYFSAKTLSLLMVMQGHQGPVNTLSPSPVRNQVLSGSDDGTARLWDLASGLQLMLFYQPYGGPIYGSSILPGGYKAVVGSQDGYFRTWDLNSGLLFCQVYTGSPIFGLATNPSNPLDQVIVANKDGYVRVFNPQR